MKKLVPILLLPVVLVLAAAAFAPKLASDARLRAEAVAAVRAATGREPRIEGPVGFSVLPWPAITAEDLTVDDEDGDSRLMVPRLRVVLHLLPLLTGQARADHIELASPELSIVGSEASLDGFSALVAGLGTSRLDADIRVTDGQLLVRHGNVSEVVIPRADVRLAWQGMKEVALKGKLTWRGEPLDVDFALSDVARLAAGGGAGLRLSASGPPAEFSFDGSVKLAGGPVAEGQLAMSSRKLRDTLEWLGLDAPTEQGFGAFALRGQALMSDQGAALSSARLELDGNVSEGGFNLRLEDGRSIVQGSLASESVDLTPYGQLTIFDSDDGTWSDDPLDLSRLARLDLDLRLSATRVRAGNSQFRRMAASAVLKNGKLSLAIGEAEAWDGIFRAAIHVAPGPNGAGADARVDLAGDDVAFAKAFGDIFRSQRLEGKGSFHLTAGGAGESIAQIVTGLDGDFTLSGAHGALVGMDVGRILDRLAKRPLSGMGDLRGGRTPFDSIELSATIAGGIARLAKFEVESSRLRIAMNGKCSIARRDLDLSGEATLMGSKEAGTQVASFELPFIVRGDWERPVVLPDAQLLIRRSGAARALFGDKLNTLDPLGVSGSANP
ncbi:AsmA family protein [Ancylobacter sp. MQZ15Z-1]|uniref:AsmA family protein n=1 Tax=Ancylobacter mangrovi TaxID=2972472 RepID=A0A9X2T4D1_9HYPH|nr:AsmA family protein [Ancylobacter mangrovi]MCS0494274.1 AsmA family protein [Ancylobacter mangrovi]